MTSKQEAVPFVTRVRASGNSIVATVPKEIMEALGLRAGDLLQVLATKRKRELEVEAKGLKEPAAVERVTSGLFSLVSFPENFAVSEGMLA